MALATQCPHCQTTFRVANDQLKLHGGLVRCGSCQQTFNGIEHLLGPTVQTAPTVALEVQVAPVVPVNVDSDLNTDVNSHIAEHHEITTTEIKAESSLLQTAELNTAVSVADSSPGIDQTPPQTPISEVVSTAVTTAANTALVTESPAAEISADSLDFDLGMDEDISSPAKHDKTTLSDDTNLDDEAIGQVELQTRIALMDEPGWSATEAEEETGAADHKQEPYLHEPASADITVNADEPGHSNPEADDYAGEPEAYLHDGLAFDTTGKADSITDDLSDGTSPATDASAESDLETPGFILAAEKRKGRSKILRGLMITLSLVLFVGLLGQGVFIARNHIAAWVPQTKPMLADACKLLHCQISLLAQIDQISLESNELQALSTDKNVFSLAIQLQNKSATAQAWPMVELILNDAKDKPVLRKVFKPEEYLSDKNNRPDTKSDSNKLDSKLDNKTDLANQLSKGFSAASDQQIKLYFELSQTKASGYHLSIFYP